MKSKQNYITPEIMEHKILSEGILCESNDTPGADAGFFEENEW